MYKIYIQLNELHIKGHIKLQYSGSKDNTYHVLQLILLLKTKATTTKS